MPGCTINGQHFDEVLVNGQPAFAEDGAPNPLFPWSKFKMAISKPMTKAKIASNRQKRRGKAWREMTREADARAAEFAEKRKARKKAARRLKFAKLVAAEVAKVLRRAYPM